MGDVFIKYEDLNPWITRHLPQKDLISISELIGAIEDLDGDVETLKERISDLEQDIECNYIPRPMSDYTGNREDDRY